MIRSRQTTRQSSFDDDSLSKNNSSNVLESPFEKRRIRSAGKAPHLPSSGSVPMNMNCSVRRIPFSVIIVIMVLAMSAMGMISIYSMLYLTDTMQKPPPDRHAPLPRIASSVDDAATLLKQVRHDFYSRYGTRESSRKLLQDAVDVMSSSVEPMAQRMLLAAAQRRPLVLAFTGYSVTVGRGNFFNQSYPFVVERVLQKPLKEVLGLSLKVRNAAIGGIPSFPYGFCLDHFIGKDADLIGWDYSLNEGPKDASSLEAFLRRALHEYHPRRPMIFKLDRKAARTELLKDYVQHGIVQDAMAVATNIDDKVIKKAGMFDQDPLPEGLQDWNGFGAPDGCPGRNDWHPKYKEHEFIGWVTAMQLLAAVERARKLQEQNPDSWDRLAAEKVFSPHDTVDFPSPMATKGSTVTQNSKTVQKLLYGHPDAKHPEVYNMHDVSCRTSFLPATDHERVLPSIIVSGLVGADLDIMKTRDDELYQKGWVLDVSPTERNTKVSVETCGGLSYIDMKIALYGIPESGQLKLFLPFEGSESSHKSHDHDKNADATRASHWFDSLILCEANDKRKEGACRLDQDLQLTVGGVHVESTDIVPLIGVAEYLKRPTCVHVPIPEYSKVAKYGDVASGGDPDAIGLVVDVAAESRVTRKKGACCLSHVVWEQH